MFTQIPMFMAFVNTGRIVNAEIYNEGNLEQALEKKIREILKSIPWLESVEVFRNPAASNRAFDIEVRIGLADGNWVELWVECQDLPRPSRFPYAAGEQRFKKGNRRMRVPTLAAPYISNRMAELCRAHGWSWFDLAGNCWLSIPEMIYLERSGNPPVHSRPRPKANLATDESARILRVLMVPENAGRRWTQRSLRDACWPKVSLGKVNAVVSHLRDQAYTLDQLGGGFCIHDPEGLLREWREVYRFETHRQRLCHTLLKPPEIAHRLADGSESEKSEEPDTCLASYSAAEHQAGHVRQPRTWLFVRSRSVTKVMGRLSAKEVESGANLVILEPSDAGVFSFGQPTSAGATMTNPVQTYLDLWKSGGRGAEAAEAILKQCLIPAWHNGANRMH